MISQFIKAIRQRATGALSRHMVRRASTGKRSPESAPTSHLGIGRRGEEAALSYLRKKGLRFLCRNWKCRAGELDLVLADGGELVFAEVKTRIATRYATKYLFDNVSFQKQKKLRLLSEIYLARYYQHRRRPPFRIDVVGVLLDKETLAPVNIRHLVAAVGDDR